MKDIYAPKTMTVRVPSFFAKQLTAEVAKRNFFKPDGRGNENEFFNKLLPNMLLYRDYKKGRFHDFVNKNIKESIIPGRQEITIELITESFDYLYFDESEYPCDTTINIRFDVNNEFLYAELFSRLDELGIKRSTYIKNLLCEYCNKSEYQKERICFNEEYNKLSELGENSQSFQFHSPNGITKAVAIALEFSVTAEHWYLLYFELGKYDTLYSIPLYNVKKILTLKTIELNLPEHVIDTINELIDNDEYSKSESFTVGGNTDA